MYFDDNHPQTWDFKEAFFGYYERNGEDLMKTLSCIRIDLISLTKKPTVLKSVKTATENCIMRRTVIFIIIFH